MSDKQSKKDFPDTNQRVAVCHSQWRRKNKTVKEQLDELIKELEKRKQIEGPKE